MDFFPIDLHTEKTEIIDEMSKAHKKLFVPIETKVREFHGKLLFALIAAEKGFEVILGGQKELQANIEKFSPGIYMDKSIADTKRGWFKRSQVLGNTMCSWDEEGLVVFDADKYFRLRICMELFAKARFFFTWGEAEANAILSKIPQASNKVCVTGNPRFDLLRPEFHSFYDSSVARINQKYGRIILVNTNFAFANFFLGEEKLQDVYRAYKISEDPGFFEGWADAQKVSYIAFLNIVPIISRRYPSHTVIIRPHPSEGSAPWQELAAQFENVVVDDLGNVHEWILASDVLIHFNCTTGIEAYFLNVPAISFRLPGNEAFHQPLPNQLSIECDDPDSLLVLVDQILEAGKNYPSLSLDAHRNSIASAHVAGMGGALASDLIVGYLDQIDSAQVPKSEDLDPPVPLHKRLWRQVLRLVRRPDPRDLAYYKRKFPGIELDEITEGIAKLQSITGRFQSVHVKKIAQNCFQFNKH